MLGCLSWMYRILAVVFIAVGVAAIVWAVRTDSPARLGVGLGVGAMAPTGIVFLLAGRYVRRLDGSKVLAEGIAGTAQVLSVRDTGVTIANLNAVFAIRAMVAIPDVAPYEAEVRATLGRQSWGTIQPGAVIPVKVDRADHARVVLDPSRPIHTAATAHPTTLAAPTFTVPAGGAAPVVQQYSAADLVARGVASSGRLEAVVPTGMTAGQLAAGLAPHEADDPVVQVSFTYSGPDGSPMRTEALVRVPDGKAGHLASGVTVPVRYLPDRPDVATIDWARL